MRSVRLLATAACLVVTVPAFGSGTERVIVEFDSAYHHIRVVQDGSIRGLRFDNNHYQSLVDVNNPLAGHFDYIELLFEAFLFKPEPDSVLALGLGGGSFQRLLHHRRPEITVRTVEIDPAVVDVAEEYFFYDSSVLPVTVSDARVYLNRTQGKWDMIVQDTYSSNRYGTFIPFHLATVEYFRLVKERLSDDGVFAVNVIGTIYGGEPNRVITSVYRTMREVFPQLYLFAAKDTQNVVIIATKSAERLTAAQLGQRARELVGANPDGFPQGFVQKTSQQYYDTVPSRLSEAIVLTDDFAPTDNLLR